MGVSKNNDIFDIFKVHHKKLSRTKMLSLRKKMSDLKSRPLKRSRVSYVCSKKNTFCQSEITEYPVKTTSKDQNNGEFLQQKGSDLVDFRGRQKSDKNWTILRLNCSKKRPFFATTKNGTKSTSRTG